MSGIKTYVSLALLAIFMVVLVPREWLHDCHRHEKVNHDAAEFNYSKCSICDYQLASYDTPQQVKTPKEESRPKKVIIIVIRPKIEGPKIDTNSTRAPPIA